MSNPTNDPFSPILNPRLRTNSGFFLDSFVQGVLHSPEPSAAMARFKAEYMTRLKAPKGWRHEFLHFTINDDKGSTFPLFVDRTSSSTSHFDQSTIAYFSQHADSGTVLKAIKKTLKKAQLIPAMLASSTYALTPISTVSAPSESLPLLQTPASPLESPLPAESPLPRRSFTPTPTPPTSQRSVTESLSLATAKALSFSASSQSLAEDRIVGEYYIEHDKFGFGQVVQETPLRLSLFALAILIHVVHLHAPLYSLFENQCYWFASIVYHAVLRIQLRVHGGDTNNDGNDNTKTDADDALVDNTETNADDAVVDNTKTDAGDAVVGNTGTDADNAVVDRVYLPLNEHLPDIGGQWIGLKVSEIEEAILNIVLSKYQALYQEFVSKVERKVQENKEEIRRREEELHVRDDEISKLKGDVQEMEAKLLEMRTELLKIAGKSPDSKARSTGPSSMST